MGLFVGLDVGKDTTAICVIDGLGDLVREQEVATDPQVIHDLLAPLRSGLECVALEAGGLSGWLSQSLKERGMEVIQIDWPAPRKQVHVE